LTKKKEKRDKEFARAKREREKKGRRGEGSNLRLVKFSTRNLGCQIGVEGRRKNVRGQTIKQTSKIATENTNDKRTIRGGNRKECAVINRTGEKNKGKIKKVRRKDWGGKTVKLPLLG